jgi:hypothetical protein
LDLRHKTSPSFYPHPQGVKFARKSTVTRQYVGEDVIRRRKLIRKFKRLGVELQTGADLEELERVEAYLTARIASEDLVERTTEWYAEQAGMEDFYRSAYSLLSEAVHVSVGQLESSLNLDEDGTLIGLVYGPSDTELEHHLLACSEALILALRAAYSVVDVQTADEIHRIHDEFNELHGRFSRAT